MSRAPLGAACDFVERCPVQTARAGAHPAYAGGGPKVRACSSSGVHQGGGKALPVMSLQAVSHEAQILQELMRSDVSR